ELWRLAALVGDYGLRDDRTIPIHLEDLLPNDATIQLDVRDLEGVRHAPPPIPRKKPRYASAWDELAASYEKALPPPQGLSRAAEVWERGAADIGRAFAALGRALAAPETRDKLRGLAERHDAWDRLADLLEAAAGRAQSAAEAAQLLHEVATLRG